MTLDRDAYAFDRELPELLKNPDNQGKYVLMHDGRVVGLWPTAEEAVAAGYDQFNVSPFLVRLVVAHEEPQYTAYNVTPCS